MTTTARKPKVPRPEKPQFRKAFPALEPGKQHAMYIPNWMPATVNQIYDRHFWVGAELKKRDKRLVGAFAGMQGTQTIDRDRPIKRRVSLVIRLAKGKRAADPDAYWKSTLDALVHADLLRNDSHVWCEHGGVIFERSKTAEFGTTIILEDI